jgi:hypothetical protein
MRAAPSWVLRRAGCCAAIGLVIAILLIRGVLT